MSSLTGTAQALLAPHSIALVGASAVEGKHTALPQRFLRSHGYDGAIYPINPKYENVFGERAYPSVSSVERKIDHALIMVPSEAVEAAVADCGRAGVRCATILSNGFAETGPVGARRQADLVAAAQSYGMRILGPNSLGLINPVDKIILSANEVLSLPQLHEGTTGLISQSGSMLGGLLSRGSARGMGFSRMVSVGNEADVGLSEVAEWLIDDDKTNTILLFLETMREPNAFHKMAARAYSAGKTLVAFRLGKSNVGSQLSASHTGAMVGGGPALESFLRDNGVVCVDNLETLLEMTSVSEGRRPAQQKRVAVLTTTGGGGGLVVDPLSNRGATIMRPSVQLRAKLEEQGISISDSPLIDLTLAGAKPEVYGTVLRALMDSPECDLIVAVVGSSAQFRPDRAIHPIVSACGAKSIKPVLVFIVPDAPEALSQLRANGIPAFDSPEICADAAISFLQWREPRPLPFLAIPPAVHDQLGSASPQLNSTESQKLLGTLGIPQAREVVLPIDREWSEAELNALSFPVVAKILAADIPHKSDVGGVILNIRNGQSLKTMAREMVDHVRSQCSVQIEGVQVQEMHSGVAELLVGYHDDPAVGPMITVGLGGVTAEVYRDIAMRPAPVDHENARTMISELAAVALLQGFRGRPRADLDAAATAISALSALALLPGRPIAEAEINPLLLHPEGNGCIAVDGLVVRH